MNLERVKDLLDLMSSSSVKELVLIDNDGEIRLRRDPKDAPVSIAPPPLATSTTETHHTSIINAPCLAFFIWHHPLMRLLMP